MYVMGRTESVDIDDAESWQMAEAMSMYLLNKPAGAQA
jgi:CMP-N-acetylneuraminic acid synthetase